MDTTNTTTTTKDENNERILREAQQGVEESLLNAYRPNTTSLELVKNLRANSISFRYGKGTGHDVKLYFEDVSELRGQVSELANAEDIWGMIDTIKKRTAED